MNFEFHDKTMKVHSQIFGNNTTMGSFYMAPLFRKLAVNKCNTPKGSGTMLFLSHKIHIVTSVNETGHLIKPDHMILGPKIVIIELKDMRNTTIYCSY